MKLTDESVAKALGWKRYPNIGTGGDLWSNEAGERVWDDYTPPRFTTSLDAIVAEIEARGLHWERRRFITGTSVVVGNAKAERLVLEEDSTASALCAALLAYLKEPKNAEAERDALAKQVETMRKALEAKNEFLKGAAKRLRQLESHAVASLLEQEALAKGQPAEKCPECGGSGVVMPYVSEGRAIDTRCPRGCKPADGKG